MRSLAIIIPFHMDSHLTLCKCGFIYQKDIIIITWALIKEKKNATYLPETRGTAWL